MTAPEFTSTISRVPWSVPSMLSMLVKFTGRSTSEDIRNMSEDELLDMDYFLNEDDLFSDEAGVEGFYIF